MVIDIPATQNHLYTGAGLYLAALDGATIRDMERINPARADYTRSSPLAVTMNDHQIKAFASRNSGARIVCGVGSGHQLSVAPDDAGDTRWTTEQAASIWHVRELLARI